MKVLDGMNHSGLGQVWVGRGSRLQWKMKREMLQSLPTQLAGKKFHLP